MSETSYLNRDNTVDLQLFDSGVAVDLTSVTRMLLKLTGPAAQTVDSNVSAGAFDWSAGSGKLTISLGGETIVPGTYTATLIVYDPTNASGIVWDEFTLIVEKI